MQKFYEKENDSVSAQTIEQPPHLAAETKLRHRLLWPSPSSGRAHPGNRTFPNGAREWLGQGSIHRARGTENHGGEREKAVQQPEGARGRRARVGQGGRPGSRCHPNLTLPPGGLLAVGRGREGNWRCSMQSSQNEAPLSFQSWMNGFIWVQMLKGRKWTPAQGGLSPCLHVFT